MQAIQTTGRSGKTVRGRKVNTAKLTEDDVRLILELGEARDNLREQLKYLTNERIAEKFDVSADTVARICSGKTWRHI